MSSLSSFFSFLPGLRPVVVSMWAQRSSSLRRTTEPGTCLLSIMYSTSHWPSMDSTSGPLASPRGSTQPADFSCEGPQGTKRCLASPSSASVSDWDQAGSMR
ncbi:hypothetical protein D9M69_521110 [compost metagenome]